jgi:hypothetical protein
LNWSHWLVGVWLPVMDKLRDIFRNSRFEQELAAIEPNVERVDEFLEGVEWYWPECQSAELRLAILPFGLYRDGL